MILSLKKLICLLILHRWGYQAHLLGKRSMALQDLLFWDERVTICQTSKSSPITQTSQNRPTCSVNNYSSWFYVALFFTLNISETGMCLKTVGILNSEKYIIIIKFKIEDQNYLEPYTWFRVRNRIGKLLKELLPLVAGTLPAAMWVSVSKWVSQKFRFRRLEFQENQRVQE